MLHLQHACPVDGQQCGTFLRFAGSAVCGMMHGQVKAHPLLSLILTTGMQAKSKRRIGMTVQDNAGAARCGEVDMWPAFQQD